MDDQDGVFADPGLEKAEGSARLPDDARFACAYEDDFVVDAWDAVLFFRRTETTDELWRAEWFDPSPVAGMAAGVASAEPYDRAGLTDVERLFVVPKEGPEPVACLRLLERHIQAGRPASWPRRFLVAGIIDKAAFDGLLGRIEREMEENRQRAQENETEIIEVARELGLQPRPSGEGPDVWWATCPGKHSTGSLEIQGAKNLFYCGYCKRGGSMAELRAFVKERSGR